MDNKTILELGSYLNDRIGPFSTCDHLLSLTTQWLDENHYDLEAELDWLHTQGVHCDCQFVIKLYIPLLFGMVKSRP